MGLEYLILVKVQSTVEVLFSFYSFIKCYS